MLTDRAIRSFRPADKAQKLYDQGGLYLLCTPGGSKLWRLKYRRAGREKVLALGSWPEVTLAEVHRRQLEAKATLKAGGDPLAARLHARVQRQLQPLQTVEALGREWHAKQAPRWSPRHAAEVSRRLERLVYPMLGRLTIGDITPPLMLACIQQIEKRGARVTAHIVRQYMDAVFDYAISKGVTQANPAAHIKKSLEPVVHGQHPALTSLASVRNLLRQVEAMPAYPTTKLALRLLALTACRPGEVPAAAWREFEQLEGPTPIWRIPPGRMKMRREHIVPLVPEAVAVIRMLQPLTGHLDLIFPSARSPDRPMVTRSFLDVLYRLGFRGRHCAHGFRSSFSTLMNERHPEDWAAIEAALAHVVGGTRGAYMRSNYLERRRELMAEWAELLLEGAPPAETLLYGPRR